MKYYCLTDEDTECLEEIRRKLRTGSLTADEMRDYADQLDALLGDAIEFPEEKLFPKKLKQKLLR